MITRIGTVLVTAGALCLLVGANLDTAPRGVINFHAVSQQQNYLILGGVTFLGGLVILCFERLRASLNPKNPQDGQSSERARSTPVSASIQKSDGEARMQMQEGADKVRSKGERPLDVALTVNPKTGLRFITALSVGVPISYFAFETLLFYPYEWTSFLILVVVAAFSQVPGDSKARLKQLLWMGIVMCGVLTLAEVDTILYFADEGIEYAEDVCFLLLILATGIGYYFCTRYVERWVTRLPISTVASD